MADSAGRLLELLSLLQSPRAWTGGELAARLEVSTRTIRRDIDRLRDLGYPIEATLGAVGGYRLSGGAVMPPLLLDDEEAVAIAVGLRTLVAHAVSGSEDASVRALAKLQQVLPPRLRGRVATLGEATGAVVWDSPTIEPEVLTDLARAIANRQRVRFDYRTADGTTSVRTVDPHGIVAAGRAWYVVAWDGDRSDWRTFRADRLQDPRILPGRFVARQLPAPDIAAFVRDRIEGAAPMYPATIVVHVAASEVRRRLIEGVTDIEELDDSMCRVRLAADTGDWLASRILRLDADFVVEEPAALRTVVNRLAGRLGRASAAQRAVSPRSRSGKARRFRTS